MKRLLKSFLVAAAIVAATGPRWGFAAQRVNGSQLFSETALAYSKTSTVLTTDDIDSLSLQAVVSSFVPTALTVYDGRKSTASVTVSNYVALSVHPSSVTVTIKSNGNATSSAVANSYLTLQGVVFKEGYGGKYTYTAAYATMTATSLAAAIQADSSGLFTATSSSNVVTVVTTSSGTGVNSYTCTSSTPAAVTCGASTFAGGLDNAIIAVNGVVLRQGTDWNAVTNASTTAKNLSDAMMARSAISSIILSTWSAAGVVTATATTTGVNAYSLFTSTAAALRLNGSSTATTDTFLNGLASDIAANTFTYNNHGLTTGLDVRYNTVTGTAPQNLVNGTTYFVIRDSASSFRLATTRALATATTPTAVTISTFTGSGSFTLTPLALSGSPAFKIQVSNDNSNWFDLAVTSVTFASPYTSTNQFWDLGTPSYGYLRVNYTVGTQGGVALTVTANGRKSGQ